MSVSWAEWARLSMEGDDEATVMCLLHDTVVSEVEDKLDWNLKAYGKAWTGEGEDTEFIVGDVPGEIISRLREAGFEVVRTRG